MKKFLFVLFIGLMLFSRNTLAVMTCEANFCNGIPDQVIAYQAGGIRIYPTNDTLAVDCTPFASGKAVVISEFADSDGKKNMYTMLLLSISAKKDIHIRLTGAGTDCEVTYIKIYE